MIDLADFLTTAQNNKGKWGKNVSLPISRAIAQDSELDLDWDGGAGEEWITLTQNGMLHAIIGSELPLVFLLDLKETEWPPQAIVVEVPSMTRPVLRCDRNVLETVFRRKFPAIEFYPGGFSALDLAMATN